jgi:hypothetical protein
MLRARRDTKMSTIEEIIEKVNTIGYEPDPPGMYHISVAGHGQAGSMACVLGYFLAANSKAASNTWRSLEGLFTNAYKFTQFVIPPILCFG